MSLSDHQKTAVLLCFAGMLVFMCMSNVFALEIVSPVNGSLVNISTIQAQYRQTQGACKIVFNNIIIPLPSCNNITLIAKEGPNYIEISDEISSKTVIFSYVLNANQSLYQENKESGKNTDSRSLNQSNNSSNLSESTLISPNFPQETPTISSLSNHPTVFSETLGDVGDATGFIIEDVVGDDPDPTPIFVNAARNDEGTVQTDKLMYSAPPGTRFTVMAKIKNTGSDSRITINPAAMYSSIESIRRVRVVRENQQAPVHVRRYQLKKTCDSDCTVDLVEDILETKTKEVRKARLERTELAMSRGRDERISFVRQKDRAPENAKYFSAVDQLNPGEEGLYEITFRAGSTATLDEFFIHALSSNMAIGLDPFIDTNWSYVRNISLQEQFNITRLNQLVVINITDFENEQLSNCTREIRVSNSTYDDIRVRVLDDGGNLSSGKYCYIAFGARMRNMTNATYFVYFGNPDAVAPAAATNQSLYWNLSWTISPNYFPVEDLGTAGDTSDELSPHIVDYNCDGANDIVYGLDDGRVLWRRNTGTNAAPVWAAAQQILASIGTNSAPSFGLLFGNDAELDMVVGENAGILNYYENTNTCAAPIWLPRTITNGSADFGTNTKPTPVDINSDGLVDIILGLNSGRLNSTENYNTTTMAAFWLETLDLPTATFATNRAPDVADFNFDGLLDIIEGNNNGNIQILLNNGTSTSESWFNAGVQRYNQTTVNIDCGARSVPIAYDINADGWTDLAIGESTGNFSVLTAASGTGKYLINAPLVVTVTSTNEKPVVQSMNLTPSFPFSNETLNCSVNVTDDNNSLSVNFTWFNGSTPRYNSTVSCANATLCMNMIAVTLGNLTPNQNWSCRATAWDGFWSGVQQQSVIVQNMIPSANITLSHSLIQPSPAVATVFRCNASITEPDGNRTYNRTSARIYLEGSDPTAADTNVSHYTNSTCTTVRSNLSTINVSCGFRLQHYATNGSWLCNITMNDTWNLTSQSTNFSIDTLYALNLTSSTINFGNVQTGEVSANITRTIRNIGNQPINISTYGYGLVQGTNVLLSCLNNSNLTIGQLRYTSNNTLDWDEKNNLTNDPVLFDTTILPQVNATATTISTYWQIGIPPGFPAFGSCNGTVVFQAESG